MLLHQLINFSPGSVSTGAGSVATAKTTGPDFQCWAKFVRGTPTTPYDGEYGFDWMDWKRDPDPKHLNDEITEFTHVPIANFEHYYDSYKQQYLAVATDAHLKRKLQDEYERLVIYGEDYYAAWLSVRPGQEIKVQLHIEALNTEAINGDYLTFGAHSSYEVTVNGQVNNTIRIKPVAGSTPSHPQTEDVTIKCLKASTATKLQVLDEKGQVVGQLNVVDNTKTYHLPIRVVYLVKDGSTSAASLSALQATYTGLHLENYLNKHSLNQAQIQADFEKTSQVYQLVFKEAEWAGKFYDAANQWFTDYVELDPKTKTVKKKTFFLDKALAEYTAKYEKSGSPFRGLVLIITDIKKNPADMEGGVSKVRPVTFRETLIYKTNLQEKASYAHEMGHALGLDHTFLDAGTNADISNSLSFIKSNEAYIASLKQSKKIYASNIGLLQKSVDDMKAGLKKNAAYYQQQPAQRKQAEEQLQKATVQLSSQQKDSAVNDTAIVEAQKNLRNAQTELPTFKANKFKYKKGSTDAIMDYNGGVGVSFFHWQWRIMQTDVTTYYGYAK